MILSALALAQAIDAYVEPYAASNNFSGTIVVEQAHHVLYDRAFGFSDRSAMTPNTPNTRFHIASMSMQFTAAAILRLVALGRLQLDEPAGAVAGDLGSASAVTIRQLLEERSGLPDINDLSNYGDILQHHQTPADLVAEVVSSPLLFAPGSQYRHEEHSAYNVLARIIEIETHETFAAAMTQLVFEPLQLSGAGIDDDDVADDASLAKGYEPLGLSDLAPATPIHWSAKAGNASVFETARDEAQWVDALFGGQALPVLERNAMLSKTPRVGYGWFKAQNARFGEFAYYMNGRSPGFSSFVLYLPNERLTVVAFSNIYSSATTAIGNDIAAIALGRSYVPFAPVSAPMSPRMLRSDTGTFRFGPDFFSPSARVTVKASGGYLSLLWPSGSVSPLIPLGADHFIDRAYWEDVRIEHGNGNAPNLLEYGPFRGSQI
jgi:CubicO group peptidase (beta-lactamase class C family)